MSSPVCQCDEPCLCGLPATAVCPLCDEVSENPEGECSETFCCKACRGEVKASLWQPSWSQARSIG
jgi:hypothetical protein